MASPQKRTISPPRTIGLLVAGMHRSGTSALTRTLNLLGAALPAELLGPSVNNPLGHWESTKLYELHNQLLEDMDSSWDTWLPIEDDWFRSPTAEFNAHKLASFLIEEFSEKPLFVLKDPRLCRVLPLWPRVFDLAGMDLRVVIPIRHPLEVVASLERRNDMAPSNGLLVWLRHVLDAEKASRGLPRSLVHYQQLIGDWRSVVGTIGDQLDLAWPRRTLVAEREIDGFLSPDHRHHRADEEHLQERHDFPEWVLQAYEAISSLIRDPSSREPLARLDAIRASFDDAARALWPVMNDQADRLQAKADAQRHQLKSERALIHRETERLNEEIVARDTAIAQKSEGISRLERDIAERQERLNESQDMLRERSDQIQRLSGEFATRAEALEGEVDRWRDSARKVADEVGAKARAAVQRGEDLSRDLAQKSGELEMASAEIRRLRSRSDAALEELNRTRDQLLEAQDKVDDLSARELEARTQVEMALRQLDGLRGEVGKVLAERDAMARDHAALMAKRTAKIQDLRASRDEARMRAGGAEKAAASADRQAQDLGARMESAAAEISRLEAQLRLLQTAHDRMRDSPSWRVTLPLRRVIALGRTLGKTP